jgi:hypothetical protein
MKLKDLDRKESSGKEQYWKMKYNRAKMDRKPGATTQLGALPKRVSQPISRQGNIEIEINLVSVILFLAALVFTILTYSVYAPAPLWMFVVTGSLWLLGSATKLFTGFSIGVIFGLFNAIMTIFIYIGIYGT